MTFAAPETTAPRALVDGFGRSFEYLRLSVTDRCNFRCSYCLPNGYQPPEGDQSSPLTAREIENLLVAFSQLGVFKVRLTGGEPTLRSDIVALVRQAKHTPGIRRVALSTNGYRLASLARPLEAAGLDAVNVSIDSLSPQRFREITGGVELDRILRGVDAVLETGVQLKVNTVLLRDQNDEELGSLIRWAAQRPITLRFIQLMRTSDNLVYFRRHHQAFGPVEERLRREGWTPRARGPGDGPAREFEHPQHVGRIGLIAPYDPSFCDGCNRLRVTSAGALRLCLFGSGDLDLRPLLRHADAREELVHRLVGLLRAKPAAHRLHEGVSGTTRSLAAVGG